MESSNFYYKNTWGIVRSRTQKNVDDMKEWTDIRSAETLFRLSVKREAFSKLVANFRVIGSYT